MRQITHAEYTQDYHKGWEAKTAEISGMGWEAARDKFNMDHPSNSKFQTLGAYYFAEGEIDALIANV